ncbi:MAG: beta-lactamase domain-containing protein [Parcubacteria group bacterium Gr01-1014_30]|nr:MAG: beta-lactamase domain-containing protein [Parcubacteria group bacterium Gr01-1014_30]
MSKRKNPVFLFLAVLVGLNALAWAAVYELRSGGLEVVFFDVGQGDATLIETPQGHHILIDGGRDSTILEKLGKEMPYWKRSVDLIILTHPHYDHMAGFIEVLKRYKVKNILWTGVLSRDVTFKEWQKLIAKEEGKVYIAKTGLQVKSGKAVLKVFYPFESFENQEVEEINDTSVVAKLIFGHNTFLWTGDAFKDLELDLVRKGIDVDSDVLQAGHHGSRTSSAPEFIEAVSPEIFVVSSGRNNVHGHPHSETLETLAKYDIKVLRTDELGDVKIISDGLGLVVKFSKI